MFINLPLCCTDDNINLYKIKYISDETLQTGEKE